MTDTFEHLDDLFLNLKILSNVGQHEKIATRTSTISVAPNSFLLACTRFVNGEKREQNLKFTRSLLTRATREIQEFITKRQTNDTILERLRQHLVGGRTGIENMGYTYQNDITSKAEADQQLDKLDDLVRSIETFQKTRGLPVSKNKKES